MNYIVAINVSIEVNDSSYKNICHHEPQILMVSILNYTKLR